MTLSTADWDRYKDVINSTQESRFQEDIIWRRTKSAINRWGEDVSPADQFEDIAIKGLFQYNVFRSWPLNKADDSGEIDKESAVLYLNLKYLEDEGYLNSNGYFDFNRSLDRFVIRGLLYAPDADTDTAQAYDNPLLIMIVLKRQEIPSGHNLIEYPNQGIGSGNMQIDNNFEVGS